MEFETDQQTRQDLSLSFDAYNNSVFDYYDLTVTRGGRKKLQRLFDSPLNDLTSLNSRKDIIGFLDRHKTEFPFTYQKLDFIEHYISKPMPLLRDTVLDVAWDKLKNHFTHQNDYYIISCGIGYLMEHIAKLTEFMDGFPEEDQSIPPFFRQLRIELGEILQRPAMKKLTNTRMHRFLKFNELNLRDIIVRREEKESIQKILEFTYVMDAFIAVAKAKEKNRLAFAVYDDSASLHVTIEGMFHLFLKDPVVNDIDIGASHNLCFISGPNMAGKSTFLKSMAICVYLAHLGFPVPAASMNTSVFQGMYTTINLSDSTALGYSHYYAEVKRVKDVVLAIQKQKRVFVIFDELFKGTNVKDAFDATLMITSAFSKIKDCIFLISTHIVEVGKELEREDGICYKYFDTGVVSNTPTYTYKIMNGISFERLGLFIVKREGIMEILDQIIEGRT